MSAKVAPTKRTNKAKAKGRAASPARVRKLPVVKRTEDDVRRAVNQSLDVLRYHHSRDKANSIIIAWACLRVLNTMRPDTLIGVLSWDYVGKSPNRMELIGLAAMAWDTLYDTAPLLSFVAATQDPEIVKKLHTIWSPFSEPVDFDFLGETYMALLHR